jgi:hypothetical protein
VTRSTDVPVIAATMALLAVVLPIPMSPGTTQVRHACTSASAKAMPVSTHVNASSAVIAGCCTKFRVPRRTFFATKPGKAGSSASTPMSTTSTRAPT